MKISYNWLKTYLDIDYPADEVAEMLTGLGLEVEGMDAFESIPGSLEGIVIGKVLTCEKHPNADKLSLTTVDIGSGADLSIVCGASNVAAGQTVLVAPVGTTIHPTNGEPFQINKAKIRGELSEGMICAEDEIGLGTSHAGILVLDDHYEVGKPAIQYFPVERDVIFEIGLTPNRSDATNHLGVAKDLAAYLRVNRGFTGKIKMPPSDQFNIDNLDMQIEVEVADHRACPRYAGITLTGVKVGPSPDWLQNRLKSIGLRPINNIVDISNFVLHEMGQPTHAFDADKITGKKIIVRTLPAGTKFLSLDDVERSLLPTDLMICDGDNNGMCIAGVFGGADSGVTDHTVNLFIESAHFNAKWVRRTSMKHFLRTDAAMVFEKGSDPNICVIALKRVVQLIQEIAGGQVSSHPIDIYPKKIEPVKIDVHYENIRKLIGVDLTKEDIRDILNALEISIENIHEGGLTVEVPTNKIDVLREVDLIEELLRVYGFNRVDFDESVHYTFNYSDYPSAHFTRNRVADYLAANGYMEAMSLSLSPSKYYDQWAHAEVGELVYINNTSNIQLDAMRASMVPGALENVAYNLNRQAQRIQLFEFGRVYGKQDDFIESERLQLTLCGKKFSDHWITGKTPSFTFYDIKAHIQQIFRITGVQPDGVTEIMEHPHLEFGLEWMHDNQLIGIAGAVKSSIRSDMGIKPEVWYGEIFWDNLFPSIGKSRIQVADPSKFPGVRRDLALIVDDSVAYAQIQEVIRSIDPVRIKEIGLFDIFKNEESLGKGKKSYAIYVLLEDKEQTMTEKQIEKIIQRMIVALEKETGAVLRKG